MSERRKSDPHTGIYQKFTIERTDGRSAPGEKHHGCRYFVLDLNHDPHAIPALRAYADSCEDSLPALAYDLRYAASMMEQGLASPNGVERDVGFYPETWVPLADDDR